MMSLSMELVGRKVCGFRRVTAQTPATSGPIPPRVALSWPDLGDAVRPRWTTRASAGDVEVVVPGKRRDHYAGDYDARAALVRRRAEANPATECEAVHPVTGKRCGRTLAEHPPTRNGDPPSWQAGHVRAGDPRSRLRPEVDVCNQSHGAIIGNRRRRSSWSSREW